MKPILVLTLSVLLMLLAGSASSQNCPATTTTFISTNPNTYYPGASNIAAGTRMITLGAAGAGTTPIATGDLLLIIQMQGAQIISLNTAAYGDGVTGGAVNGYLSNSSMQAGRMEYIVATNSVPLTGGVLTLYTGTVNSFRNAPFGTNGQYRYQVIRIGLYYNLTLNATITAPSWNGTTGGVLVLSATNILNFNGQRLTAAGAGFRGGGGRQLSGASGGAITDYVTTSALNYHASKAEGMAGTPRYVNNRGSLLDNGSANEGYPGGSYAAGAPGNAGGGGTDGNPSSNDQNSGGGGGANGGRGGRGGNSWSSNLVTGGEPGAVFAQNTASRMVMGGGGGAGTSNNGTGLPLAGLASSGAAGGGIILVNANTITGTGTIDVSGESGYNTALNDATGGGGAGGSVLLYAGSGLSGITVTATGGTGGTNSGGGAPHGPGGGGGGGVIYSNDVLNAASSAAGGDAGFTSVYTTHYGAAAGATGVLVQNITRSQIPNQFLYCSLLPVSFTGISAEWQQSNVLVNWTVSDENGVASYTVEKSTDGINFTAAGNATAEHTFTDTRNTGTTITYYRVKQTGQSGSILYSAITSVRAQQYTETNFTVSPNPAAHATASIHFSVSNASASTVLIRMVSLSGITVWQKQSRVNAGANTVQIDKLETIPCGTYIIQYTDNKMVINTKFVVQH